MTIAGLCACLANHACLFGEPCMLLDTHYFIPLLLPRPIVCEGHCMLCDVLQHFVNNPKHRIATWRYPFARDAYTVLLCSLHARLTPQS